MRERNLSARNLWAGVPSQPKNFHCPRAERLNVNLSWARSARRNGLWAKVKKADRSTANDHENSASRLSGRTGNLLPVLFSVKLFGSACAQAEMNATGQDELGQYN